MGAFRIYYSDGSTYDGATTDEAMNAPVMGALVVKEQAPSNVEGFSLRSATFFCWETYPGNTERWGAKDDLFGLCQYYAGQVGPQKVLIGVEVDDRIYQEARRQAVGDGYLDKRKGT